LDKINQSEIGKWAMKKINKQAILVILLVLPVLFFLFLNQFGKNHYNIPIYYALDSVKVGDKWKKTYHTIPSFQLTNQEGKPFGRKEMKGKIVVADFFFTRCGNPTFCPRMAEQMKRIQDMFEENKEVLLLSHTVDPEYDTPEVLREYADKYQAKDGKWVFLTGKKRDIYELAFQGYKINALEEGEEVTPDFLHAVKFILLDNQGRVRGYYDGTDSKDVDRLMIELKILLYELKEGLNQ
jgi:protein SCO1